MLYLRFVFLESLVQMLIKIINLSKLEEEDLIRDCKLKVIGNHLFLKKGVGF
jgi:hypothetical protein